jgi:branched-subunit amino acid ABC-type transport system permease component
MRSLRWFGLGRCGWIADAVSEEQRFARSLGWSVERVSALTCSLGCALARLGGILIAPLTARVMYN